MYKLVISLCFVASVYSNLCVNTNKSCADQLWSDTINENHCQMVYHNRNTCYLEHFQQTGKSPHGYVSLKTFVEQSRTAFNVTIHDIKWNMFRMRFKQHLVQDKCTYRTFYINNLNISSDRYLYYDCPWSTANAEGKVADFEYEYTIGDELFGRKFTFIVPKHESISDYQNENNLTKFKLFLYVDVTDLPVLKLRFALAPKQFNVTSYKIQVYHGKENQINALDTTFLSSTNAKYNEIEFEYSTYGYDGIFYFTVSPVHPDCNDNECVTESYAVQLPETFKLYLGIVSVSTLLTSILIVLYLFRKQCSCKGKNQIEKSILLVSTPPNDAHVDVIKSLGTLLRNVYNMNVMIDLIDVPQTQSKDPFSWFTKSFSNATHIVFLLSQKKLTTTKTVYQNTDHIVYRLMKEDFAKKSSKKKYSVISFSYSTHSLPDELISAKHFHFMDDFDSFLNYLQNKSFWKKVEEKVEILPDEFKAQLIDSIKTVENNLNELNDDTKTGYNTSFKLKTHEEDKIFISFHDRQHLDKTEFLYDVNTLNLTGLDDKDCSSVSVNDKSKINVHDLVL